MPGQGDTSLLPYDLSRILFHHKRRLSETDVARAAGRAPKAAKPPGDRIVLLVEEIKIIRNVPLVVAERLGYLKGDGFVVTVMNIRDDISTKDIRSRTG